MMASDDSSQGQQKRTFDTPSISYDIDSILVSDACGLPGINSDSQQMSCECLSCPTITSASPPLVSFKTGELGGNFPPWGALPPFFARVKCEVCPLSTTWTICVACESSITKCKTPRHMVDHIMYAHGDYYEAHLRLRKRRRPNQSSEVTSVTHPSPDHNDPVTRLQPGPASLLEQQESDSHVDHGADDWVNDQADDQLDAAPNLDLPCPRYPLLTHPALNVASGREASREFFFRDQTPGNGMKYLAARAQFGPVDAPPDSLDAAEVKMMMQTAELAMSLPKTDRVRLAKYTKTVCEVVKKQTLEEVAVEAGCQEYRPWTLRPITSPFEMRRQMKDGSKDSMMYTVPHVNVMEVGAHAVSLPSDCLQDLLGHGFPLDYIPNKDKASLLPAFPVRSISSASMCRKLFDINESNQEIVADYYVGVFEWSDDFEPNTSITKSNRGGVWSKTHTFCAPGGHSHKLAYTYPVAMGPKNISHEEAEKVIREDLLMLARPQGIVIYSKEHGGLIRICAKLIVCLQDQPERRGENHLTGGASDYHRRFGYSFPWQNFKDELRPCMNCRVILLDKTKAWVCPPCVDCTNFAHDVNHPLLKLDTDSEENGHPGVMKLDFKMLEEAALAAHEAYVAGMWTTANVHKWLKIHCIKEATATLILVHADKCKEFDDVMGDPESSDALRDAVRREKQRKPDLYAPWTPPSVWIRGVHLDQHPDIPMHLLCLGMVQLVMFRAQKWMTKKNKGKPFVREMKGTLESVQELNLSWCPTLPYKGGRFGGWVSGNYLSMSRLMCWFYSGLDEIVADEEPWTEPSGPAKDWTGSDCSQWLKERDLPRTGSAKELRARVIEYLLEPIEDQPMVVEQAGGPVEQVQETIVALTDMMSLLMVEQIDGEEYYVELSRTIRVFLTLFADLEERLTKKNKLPSWLASFNCLSLLNLPDIVRLYGPIRNIWEGSWVGEGFLRFAKPAIVHGLRKFWQRSTMNNLMRMKGMQVLVGEMEMDPEECDDDDPGKPPSPEPGLFKCYKSILEVDDRIRTADKAISFIVVGGRVGVACLELGVARFVPVIIGEFLSTKMGLHYFRLQRELRGDAGAAYTELVVDHIAEVGIMLPQIQFHAFSHAQFIRASFTLVDRSHRHLDREGRRFCRKSF
jgi:hypothetical protein